MDLCRTRVELASRDLAFPVTREPHADSIALDLRRSRRQRRDRAVHIRIKRQGSKHAISLVELSLGGRILAAGERGDAIQLAVRGDLSTRLVDPPAASVRRSELRGREADR